MENLNVSADPWFALGIVVFCLALSAFFSGAETALTAASRARMHALEKSGDQRAGLVNRLLMMKERFIGAMLIGNNVVNIGASAFTTSVLIQFFGAEGTIYATIVMSVLVIIFAEVMPKTIAISSPDRAALSLSRP
jgi:Mg2+/Co2+ transporter CorB